LKIENRQKLVRVSLKKSRKSLEAAAALLRDGFSESAVSRAYYAAFYLAQAALATKDISRNKHSGVIAAFGESLTKTSILPENLHKLLINLYNSESLPTTALKTSLLLKRPRRLSKQPRSLQRQWRSTSKAG
jgi:uncharacterized protein (UPF0332 family)